MNIVRQHQPIARSEITELTSLSQQSVHRIIERLTCRKFLASKKAVVSGRGKPSPRIVLDEASSVSFGISVRTDKVEFVACNLSGDELKMASLEVDPNDREGVLSELNAIMSRWLTSKEFECRFPIGVGVAMQGYRTNQQNSFTTPDPIQNWSRVPVDLKVSSSLGLVSFTENNATCAAIAELHCGGGQKHKSLAYLSFNYGFGGGIIWENHAVLGGFGNAGELGNLFTENEMKHRPALGELVVQLKSRGVKLEGIHDLLKNFDPFWPGVDEWLNDIAPMLNMTIRAIRAILDPEAIYFGGEAPDRLRDMLIDKCNLPVANKFGEKMPFPALLPSLLAGDAAARGAAILPTRQLIF